MAPKEMELHIKPVLDAPVVRPGDALLVRVGGDVTYEHALQLKSEMEARLPGVIVHVIPADQLVIYRPEPGADA
jgi:hypothetical protein